MNINNRKNKVTMKEAGSVRPKKVMLSGKIKRGSYVSEPRESDSAGPREVTTPKKITPIIKAEHSEVHKMKKQQIVKLPKNEF